MRRGTGEERAGAIGLETSGDRERRTKPVKTKPRHQQRMMGNEAHRSQNLLDSCASRTRTERPARARVIAAASPFGPAPTTTASYCTPCTLQPRPEARGPRPLFWNQGREIPRQITPSSELSLHEARRGQRVAP